jgi:uncharacterized protein (TIGR03437 family)
MRFLAAALVFAAPLLGQSLCDFTVSPTTVSVGSAASTGGITVDTSNPVFCTGWTASSGVAWLKITSVSNGAFPGAANYSVEANTSAFERRGAMTVATKTVTVIQAAANCNFSIGTLTAAYAVAGGTGSFPVRANCAWLAFSGSPWITVPNNTGGIADGTVNYTVAANGCVASRSGTITVQTNLSNPPVFSITQEGSPANLTLSSYSATADSAAGDARITVTTGADCGWSAFSDVSWMQILNGASGTGSGAIVYHLLANATAPRTGSIHVGSLLYTVTQQASGPPPVTLTSVNNAANYAVDAVSPGEIVTLFGTNLGPQSPATLQVSGGAVTNSLAGTQVLFDGTAGPMIYTSRGQVSTVVPYSGSGKASTVVQVRYQGVISSSVTMPVQAATPAIFTLDASGLGPGAILNQDSTVNAGLNAAAPGCVVAIYCTGGGITSPALADGAITGTPLPLLTQTVEVTIGGIPAKVLYKGGAPTAVAGLTQINAEIPAGVTPGPAVQVTVKVGAYTSQAGVTLAVK